MKRSALALCLLVSLAAGCDTSPESGASGRQVETSGKADTSPDALPAAVLAAVRAARPDLEITEAEYEVRDGREYYDVGGTLPDGSELELDMTRIDGNWTVVEFQRDIEFADAPEPVRAALASAQGDWRPERIIESDQGDGVVIYEFFGIDAAGAETKHEVKWAQGEAGLLRDEWQH